MLTTQKLDPWGCVSQSAPPFMAPRIAGLLTFLAVVAGLNFWGGRRDKPAGSALEITPPTDFNEAKRTIAAAIVGGDDEKAVEALMTGTSRVWFHWSNDDGDESEARYTEVVELSESDYPFRPGEELRDTLFGKGVVEIGDVAAKVVETKVVKLDRGDAVFAKLEAPVKSEKYGKQTVRVFRWVVPTDKGMGMIDAYCLAEEESKYASSFQRMAAGAKGLATRPERLPWYLTGAIGAVFGLAMAFGVSRLTTKAPPPPPKPAPTDDDEDEDEEEEDPDPKAR